MKIGVMNNPRLPLLPQAVKIGEEGYDFLDLTLEGPMALNPDAAGLSAILERFGMSVVGHTDPCLPYAYPVDGVREACFRELERCARIFQCVGAEIMNIHPCYSAPPGAKNRLMDHHFETLPALVDMAASYGLTLVLENFSAPFDSVDAFEMLLEAAPGLGLHLDVGHTHFGRDGARAFCRRLGGEIRHVHFSDNRGNADHHMPLGVGGVNWAEVTAALKAAGYDTTITLEVFCQDSDMLWTYLDVSRAFVNRLWESD